MLIFAGLASGGIIRGINLLYFSLDSPVTPE